jgi:ABC-2 type transport system permease protein
VRSLTVARKDFADARRSWTFRAVVALFVLLTAGVSAVPMVVPSIDATVAEAIAVAVRAGGLLFPVIALVAAYHSVTGERESGSLRVLLSLPPSRRDVVVGKLLGRGAVVLAAVAVAAAATAVVAVLGYGSLPLASLASLSALLALVGLACVGVAVGVSAAVRTRARAMALVVAFYLVTGLLWNVVVDAVRLVAGEVGLLVAGATPGWLRLLSIATPTAAFNRAYDALSGSSAENAVGAGGTASAAAGAGGPDPLAAALGSWPLPVALLLAWSLLPPAFGYLRFRGVDLD